MHSPQPSSKVHGKSAYVRFENASHYLSSEEKFGLVPLPDLIAKQLDISLKAESRSLEVTRSHEALNNDSSIDQRNFLAKSLGTQFNVGPITTRAEESLFWQELRRINGSNPAFAKRPIFTRLTRSLNAHANFAPGQDRVNYHMTNHVVRFWAQAKVSALRRGLHIANADTLADVDNFRTNTTELGQPLAKNSLRKLS